MQSSLREWTQHAVTSLLLLSHNYLTTVLRSYSQVTHTQCTAQVTVARETRTYCASVLISLPPPRPPSLKGSTERVELRGNLRGAGLYDSADKRVSLTLLLLSYSLTLTLTVNFFSSLSLSFTLSDSLSYSLSLLLRQLHTTRNGVDCTLCHVSTRTLVQPVHSNKLVHATSSSSLRPPAPLVALRYSLLAREEAGRRALLLELARVFFGSRYQLDELPLKEPSRVFILAEHGNGTICEVDRQIAAALLQFRDILMAP